jgi:hypothetical protein
MADRSGELLEKEREGVNMVSRRSFLASLTGSSLSVFLPDALKWAAPQTEPRRFSVQFLNGVPAILNRLQPVLPMAHFPITMTPKAVADFDGAGIHFFTFHLNQGLESAPYPAGHYPLQTDSLDKIAGYILAQSAESYLMPRVLLWEPPDQTAWEGEHPGESYLGRPSLGSRSWKASAEEQLRNLVRHVEASSYRDRVIGYHVGWGTAGEWMYWGWDNPNAIDRSPAIVREFRNWLQQRYRGQLTDLQRAWGPPNVNFQNAEAPTDEDLRHADVGMFIDPARSRIVPDYYEFLSDLNAELVQYFGKVVKQETKEQALYGVFYGYDIHSNFNDYRLRASAHCSLNHVLEMPEVDFVCSPNGYYDRNVGGMDFPQGVTTSVQAHGKVYFNEVDSWTYLSPPDSPGRCGPFKPGTNTWLASPEATREVLRRNFCHSLVEGHALWWMTCQRNAYWYSAPDILENLKHMAKIHRFGLGTDRRSIAQVALVLDDRSVFYLKLDPEQNVMNPCVFSQMFELRRMGTPYNTYLLDDVVAGRVPPHKLYIFLNAFAITQAERDALHKIFQRDRPTVAWIYAAGFISEQADMANIEKLVGIRVRADLQRGPLNLRITNNDHELTRPLAKGFNFHSNLRVLTSWQGQEQQQPASIVSSPIFFVDDPAATILGLLTANDKPGYALKPVEGWQSVYLGAAPAPAAVWREIARYAGAQVLNEAADVLYADRSWLALHTDQPGVRHISLPFRVPGVFEAFSREKVAGPAQQFSFKAGPGKTYLFYLGPPSDMAAVFR